MYKRILRMMYFLIICIGSNHSCFKRGRFHVCRLKVMGSQIASTLKAAGCWLKCRPTCGNWQVGADLLFDQVRSKEYAVLGMSSQIIAWIWCMTMISRTYCAKFWSAFWYNDCLSDPNGNSALSVGSPCSAVPLTGPVWELFLNILYLVFNLTLTCMLIRCHLTEI